MGTERDDIEVQPLTDKAGNLYLLPSGLAEDLRVPERLKPALEEALTEREVEGFMDINAMANLVLRETYQQQSEDLRHYLEQVRYYNRLRRRRLWP